MTFVIVYFTIAGVWFAVTSLICLIDIGIEEGVKKEAKFFAGAALLAPIWPVAWFYGLYRAVRKKI